MSRPLIIAAGALSLLAAAFFGLTYWSGSTVVGSMEQQTASLTAMFPSLKVEQQIDRGLFSTTRKVKLVLGCTPSANAALLALAPNAKAPPPEPLELEWRDVVRHGPVAGSRLALASIDTELVSPKGYEARIEALTGKKPLISAHTTVDFSGGTISDLTVPALHHEEPGLGTFQSEPILARIEHAGAPKADGSGHYVSELKGVSFVTKASDGTALSFKLGDLKGQSDVAPKPDNTLWFGGSKSRAKLSSLELHGTPAADTLLKPFVIELQGMQFDNASELKDGLFSSSSAVTGKGKFNQQVLDQIEMRGSLHRLHAQSYQKLVRSVLSGLFSCDPAQQQIALDRMFSDLQAELGELLVHDPSYGLDKLAVDIGGQRAELSYSMGTKGITKEDLSQPLPALLLSKGVMNASAKIDRGLLAQAALQSGLMDPAAVGVLPPGSDPKDIALGFVDGMSEQMIQVGYIEREGDALKSSASFENGQLKVNGKPFVLPDFDTP